MRGFYQEPAALSLRKFERPWPEALPGARIGARASARFTVIGEEDVRFAEALFSMDMEAA